MTAVWFWAGLFAGFIWAALLFGLSKSQPPVRCPNCGDCLTCHGLGYDSSGQTCPCRN